MISKRSTPQEGSAPQLDLLDLLMILCFYSLWKALVVTTVWLEIPSLHAYGLLRRCARNEARKRWEATPQTLQNYFAVHIIRDNRKLHNGIVVYNKIHE